ncbi:MAG: BolA/IbaG family iron-sulfur metabolism protein [Gammaproteobacteria bacterium]|jgi:acid stress-induced BolA-like protein IbaG/YrbA|nr:BolA/IbaG family iron-sulfur metabolism protein [Gammaproteobacteria bacterium]MBQ0775315.1 BolA/IbaG family iron-sulfur metabolism protein [Gammaproteobacteria bacterium]|tara:strand:- start:117130 stop:117384 length:255 start_codon:yes stop_codon:yes gene_type:complete
MTAEEVKALLEAGIEGAVAMVEGGGDRFVLRVVAPAFEGLSPVKKQQLVYGCVNDRIADGSIHAIEMQTFTPAEWDKAQRMGTF